MNQLEKSALVIAAGLGGWALTRAIARARFSFEDKVVMVTGGSRGLGLVLARELARQGADVAICARDPDELERAGHDIAQFGNAPYLAECDVRDADDVAEAVADIEAGCGPIDVLVNNAGTICAAPLLSMTREDFEEALNMSFWHAYNTVEAVLPGMRERGAGRIVNISSIGGKVSVPHLVPYCVGKFALVGYSHGLCAELASEGITVTTVCPGLMRTGSPRNAFFKGQAEKEFALFKLSDSLPFLTISAERAAHDILEACRRGDAEIVLSLPAKCAVTLQALCPETMATLMQWTARFLPGPHGATEPIQGKEFDEFSLFTVLTDQAAQRNNEIAPEESLAVR
jgi:NAD(P)-dependent dehydrogenase (short-subunit alcohol dehydrogenase family)